MVWWIEDKISKLQTSITWLKGDVIQLKEEIKKLKRDNDQLRVDLTAYQDRYRATLNFFEYRVDQIYQGVTSRLSNILEGKGLIVASDVSPQLSSDGLSQTLLKPIPEWRDKILASQSRFLPLGEFRPPLTLYGFRLNTDRALERLDHIEIIGGETGVAFFGPYKRLPAGNYLSTFTFSPSEPPNITPRLAIEVFNATCNSSVASTEVNSFGRATLEFKWLDQFADDLFELRIHQRGDATVELRLIEVNRACADDQGKSEQVVSSTEA
jgi:FtsZ-binding cell division protein ZapB